MASETPAEEIQRVKAIDILPGDRWAVWSQFDGGEPFLNTISLRRWGDDGEHIWFMLDSHNFLKARPDEEIEVVWMNREGVSADIDKQDAARMANRPRKPEGPSAAASDASCRLPHLLCCDPSCTYHSVLASTSCVVCRARDRSQKQVEALRVALRTIEEGTKFETAHDLRDIARKALIDDARGAVR